MERALSSAAARGLEALCRPEEGALLHVLAARRGTSRAAEIGTGPGVRAAWIVAALSPGTPFFTVELDPALAEHAAGLFHRDPDVTVLCGSWREALLPEAPFDFLSVGADDAKDDVDAVVSLLAPGGTAVLADVERDPAEPDARRDSWLGHALLTVAEIWPTQACRALVAVRR